MFASQHEMHTSNPVHDYKFSWTIENFHLLTLRKIRGPDFCPIPGESEKFFFELEYRRVGNQSSDDGYLDFRIINVDNNMQDHCLGSCGKVQIKNNKEMVSDLVTIGVMNIKPFATLYSFSKHSFSKRYGTISLYNPFTQSNLSRYGLTGTITLEGTLKLSGYNVESTIYTTIPESNYEELQRDFKSMLESGTGSDVTFTIGEQTLRAHKTILVARSEVFARMFRHDMLENRTNNVVIEDVDFDTFKRFLVYLYTGNLELAEGDISKALMPLYSVAQKYQVVGLRKICLARLTKQLSVESVCADLVLADLHGDAELKSILKIYLRENFFSVAGTAAWTEIVLSKPTLMQEVLDFVKPSKSNP